MSAARSSSCSTCIACATRKADLARFLLTDGAALTWPEKAHTARARFGADGTSEPSLRRILAAVDGVDPINFAPALAPGYKPAPKRAPISDEAWGTFLAILREAAPTFPLTAAWRDVRDLAPARGWVWPIYRTVHRRWRALGEVDRLAIRHGVEEAAGRLALPVRRAKPNPMEWVSLDGRTLDVWADFGDGKPRRPTMIALVDVGSNYVVGFELVESENARATVRVIRDACARFGIFDHLYTDNGSAFAGHLVAGGADHRFRGKASGHADAPLGICRHLGIDLRFALPANAQAKIAERAFATLSRVVDDRPEFAGAHAGHAPGASPTRDVTAVPIEELRAIYACEVERHNREPGRKGTGANGRSYEAVFHAGLAARVRRVATAEQLRLAGLVYARRAVDRFGRVALDGWTYGDPASQAALLPYHGTGERVLIGRDPDDLAASVIAFDAEGRVICEAVQAQRAGPYDSRAGAEEAARNRKAARRAAKAAEEANATVAQDALRASLAQLDAAPADPAPDPGPAAIVAGEYRRRLAENVKRNFEAQRAARRAERELPGEA